MENTELLMHLAEIAGVFVGFGALISVQRRPRGAAATHMLATYFTRGPDANYAASPNRQGRLPHAHHRE